ncbi:MAG TPA: lipoyl synthase [Acidimicrobiales bacterium]|nr:lipoyl synthase [Acidimicrobiales bacterium]
MTLHIRWLGRVRYQDALALQRGLFRAQDDWLLLLEHDHVYTMGVRAQASHVLVDPASVGAELVKADRGGDVTYHGPGQLTGYPILSVPLGPDAVPGYVHTVEQVIIDALADLGLPGAGRLPDYPGVWIEDRKICAIGVRVSRGRSMHGFALNVDPDLGYFGYIIPCGITDKAVTSLAAEGLKVTMRQVVDAVSRRAEQCWGGKASPGAAPAERQDVAWRVRPEDLSAFTRGIGDPGLAGTATGTATATAPAPALARRGGTALVARGGTAPVARGGTAPVRLLGRLAEAGVDAAAGHALGERKPEWLRPKVQMGPEYRALKHTMRSLDLVTVCEEAGCPNIFQCWADGTATFMINGDRCTRACGFCLVDTRKPEPPDEGEPARVAEAVARMGVSYAVVTAVARDDLADGGATGFAATIAAIRGRCPQTAVEVLIPDCRGEPAALRTVFDARPDVLNHNIETVPRLQRAVRPSASYARSLAVLARAKAAGLTTKSGLILGLGETDDEVAAALADLHGVGCDIVTIGQYLRPTGRHLPVLRWWAPSDFERLKVLGEGLGIPHVEASPLTRSSFHARQAAEAVTA